MPLLTPETPPRIWLGTASNVSSHYDTFDNLACVIAGQRRFTLYAPELIGRLYIGPIDRTMAGPPVSLAASSPPDDQRFPLFREVRDQAWVCELGAGDALYLPKLWWHQVESLAAFNGLINYWWDAYGVGADSPYTSLLLAMIMIAERPPLERQAWRAFFDHYVFRTNGHPLAHLPPEEHGLLGRAEARQLRQYPCAGHAAAARPLKLPGWRRAVLRDEVLVRWNRGGAPGDHAADFIECLLRRLRREALGKRIVNRSVAPPGLSERTASSAR